MIKTKFNVGTIVIHKWTGTMYKVNNSTLFLYELIDTELNQVFINAFSMIKDFRLASNTEKLLYGQT